MAIDIERARDHVSEVRSALLSVEAAAEASGDQVVMGRLHRLRVLLRQGVGMIADHFGAAPETFSGGEDKPSPPNP